ncbi:MAG: hypothetical protein JWQ18_1010 [Conexibacter sp.]|nr:hypothetical protein [Conexibacter sp.]
MNRSAAGVVLSSLATVVVVLAGSIASAQAVAPALSVAVAHSPSTFQRGDTAATYQVTITNSGDADTAGTITVADVLPQGVAVRFVDGGVLDCPTAADVRAGTPLDCTTSATLAPGESLAPLNVTVAVATDAPDTAPNTATVSGGGAASASTTDPAPVVDRPAFDVLDFTARSLDAGGDDYTVAGGHPYEATTTFSFPTYAAPIGRPPVEDVKDIFTKLPPGFVGNAAVAPRCELVRLQSAFPSCPAGSKVGELTFGANGGAGSPSPVYNMVPERGSPAEFAFKIFNNAIVMYPRVRARTGDYGLTVTVPGASRIAITSIGLTFYGVPSQRNGTGGPPIPFLTNQSDCLVAQPATTISVDSWQQPARKLDDGFPDLSDDKWKTATAPAPPVTGCDAPALASQFAPGMTAGPTPGSGTTQADAPSGYEVDLTFPQTNDATDPSTTFDPDVPAAPQLKDATVVLPAGVTLSPSAADGLEGCSDLVSGPGGDQVRLDSTTPVTCPGASKIGTVVATSPLLPSRDSDTDAITGAEPINGDIYLVKPHPGDLSPAGDQDGTFRMVIELESERDGLNVKLPGVVTADRVTGRLTARFEDNPQLPVKTLSLTFKGGDRAPLVNPVACGTATTTGAFTPWSRPGTRSDGLAVLGTPDVAVSSVFEVSWDGKGAPCPATLPFAPAMTAGTVDQQAGASSPFAFDLSRGDRQDVLGGLSVRLPTGLLAAVKNVPLCSDADANGGTCPAATRVGSATVASGPGGSPFYLAGQPVSLTGPYKGAPYGLAIAVHAVAGPFDLGTVVVRQALNIDADDAHVTVVSDPLPTIRDGVPLRIRRIHVSIDRPGFMRSPTSCDAKTITSDVSSAGGQTASLAVPFQVAGCAKLPFAPKLAMRLVGAGETKIGGHPGVEALVTQQPGEAALKSATVTLPLSLALDPDNAVSDDLCEFGDGLKDQCPERSVVGTVTAVSPLLKAPLSGKVFFVKGIRADPKTGRLIRTLPTLLVELRGEINLNLRAVTSLPDGKHLVTTFPMIPDAPISSFFLKLNGGPHGILVATDGQSICGEPQVPFFTGVGQNGKRVDTSTTLSAECPLALSRTFTSTSVKVRVTGIGPGTVTVSGTGLATTRRTIASATSATVVAKLTTTGKRLRKAKQDVRVKVSFLAKGTKKARTVSSPKAKAARKRT